MQVVVKKFGGTSVGNIEKIKRVANIISRSLKSGQKVVVVLSAMSGVTDSLIETIRKVSDLSSPATSFEYDSILSSGEQVSAGLLALALQSIGLKARSYLGWQLPIKTDGNFSSGNIVEINTAPILQSLSIDEIPVICGFQGVYEGRIVTLGRGGSDTTAAAIAAALNAERCYIYTDISGVYTSDPKIVEKANQIEMIAYAEMLEMSMTGAKVLHPRAVEIAMRSNLKMQVLSTFDNTPGTILVSDCNASSKNYITGIAGRSDIAVLMLPCADIVGSLAQKIYKLFEYHSLYTEVLQLSAQSLRAMNYLVFIVNKSEINKVQQVFASESQLRGMEYTLNTSVAKIAIVNTNTSKQDSILQKMFQILSEKGINILATAISKVKVAVLVDDIHKELAMRSLHTAFGLDREE
ncbi:aspartate kinase [Candidatus Lariskella endosymbiont of Hedychridium roseum]|uniref:aspartate kinase n=1 Tax=Candidatus Lariskella endosymbiont of Hedychridium roseum TaxID=3077949 RepID=UPI0030CAF2F9